MGELILCNTGVAANSYYIDRASLNIYSLEELSFYIYNNAYLMDEGFIDSALCNWIAKDLGYKRLASEVLQMIEDDVRLNVIVGHILKDCGYLTRAEIKRTLDIISSFEGKTEAEARKIRADHLMQDGRLLDAVFAYENILDMNLKMTDELKGNICHNLGCALSELLMFDRAVTYFEQGYRLNRNKASRDMLLLSCLFASDEDSFYIMENRYQVLPEEVKEIRDSYENALNCPDNLRFNAALKERIQAAKDEVEKEFIYSDCLLDFKAKYRSLRSF